MLEKIKSIIKSKKFFWICFAIVLAIGIFLRTYHFSDWLRFSPDQARDVMLVDSVINGGQKLPLIGPQAGNTRFSLGPLYYQMQYLSAKIFGVSPEAMAYPDLFFSILSIPVLFLFLKKYFSRNISLALMALFSISYFAIINSRFASNPNSIPFFVLLLLFSLLEMMNLENKNKFIWPALAGTAIGVGMQLHTLLLLIMPAVTFLVLVYLFKNKILTWKSFFVLVFFVLLMNTGQIIHEMQTSGANTQELFKGVDSRSGMGNKMGRNISFVFACQVQVNMHIISSTQEIEECGGVYNIGKTLTKNKTDLSGLSKSSLLIFGTAISFLFSIGGYILLVYFFRKEKDSDKNKFLGLVFLYNVVSFAVMVPVATEISMRFLIILFFVPFVLLGLWLKFIFEKMKKSGRIILFVIFVLLIATNIFVVWDAGAKFAMGLGSTSKNSVLGEIKPIAEFIVNNSAQDSEIYINGKKAYLKRFFKPLKYLIGQLGRDAVNIGNAKKIHPGTQVFYVAKSSKNAKVGDSIKGHLIIGLQKFNNIEIFVLKW